MEMDGIHVLFIDLCASFCLGGGCCCRLEKPPVDHWPCLWPSNRMMTTMSPLVDYVCRQVQARIVSCIVRRHLGATTVLSIS